MASYCNKFSLFQYFPLFTKIHNKTVVAYFMLLNSGFVYVCGWLASSFDDLDIVSSGISGEMVDIGFVFGVGFVFDIHRVLCLLKEIFCRGV